MIAVSTSRASNKPARRCGALAECETTADIDESTLDTAGRTLPHFWQKRLISALGVPQLGQNMLASDELDRSSIKHQSIEERYLDNQGRLMA
jgi:hypothetical protein